MSEKENKVGKKYTGKADYISANNLRKKEGRKKFKHSVSNYMTNFSSMGLGFIAAFGI